MVPATLNREIRERLRAVAVGLTSNRSKELGYMLAFGLYCKFYRRFLHLRSALSQGIKFS